MRGAISSSVQAVDVTEAGSTLPQSTRHTVCICSSNCVGWDVRPHPAGGGRAAIDRLVRLVIRVGRLGLDIRNATGILLLPPRPVYGWRIALQSSCRCASEVWNRHMIHVVRLVFVQRQLDGLVGSVLREHVPLQVE